MFNQTFLVCKTDISFFLITQKDYQVTCPHDKRKARRINIEKIIFNFIPKGEFLKELGEGLIGLGALIYLMLFPKET